MAVISFGNSPAQVCVLAGWEFRLVLLPNVRLSLHDDVELDLACGRAQALGYLILELEDVTLAGRLSSAIKNAAAQILEGKLVSAIVDRFDNEATTLEYLKGLRMVFEAAS